MNTNDDTTTPELHLHALQPSVPQGPRRIFGRRDFLTLLPTLAALPLVPKPAITGAIEDETGPSQLGLGAEPDRKLWCVCLEVMPGLEIYFLSYYDGQEEVPGALVPTDENGRLLYCTDTAQIPQLRKLGCKDLAGEPDLEDVELVSIPDALKKYRYESRIQRCWELHAVFDVMTDLLASMGYTYDNGIYNFLMGCFLHQMNGSTLPWDEVIRTRGHRGITVGEGIQLGLGIVVANGRLVGQAKAADISLKDDSTVVDEERAAVQASGLNSYAGSNGCLCLEIMAGLRLYFRFSNGRRNPRECFVAGTDGRLLCCTRLHMLEPEHRGSAVHDEAEALEVSYVSVPKALEELRSGMEVGACWELLCLFDVLDDLVSTCTETYDGELSGCVRYCYEVLYHEDVEPWEELLREGDYHGLCVEEIIQLALGIVLANGRLVA